MLKIADIIEALRASGIDEYVITETHSNSAEMYFIKRELDMRRHVALDEYSVDVSNVFTEDGKKFRGQSTVLLYPDMTALEMQAELVKGYRAAAYVKNPYYELFTAAEAETMPKPDCGACGGENAGNIPELLAGKAAEALFKAQGRRAFINSAEVFGSFRRVHTVTSSGIDVSYSEAKVRGEYVVQCKTPADVEQYFNFDLTEAGIDSLTGKAEEALRTVEDRSVATESPDAGEYDVVLSGRQIGEIMRYYLSRSNVAMIFPGYSDWQPGTQVQGDNIRGDALCITAGCSVPYGFDGVPMTDRELVSGGELKLLQGPTRFARYLGLAPVGNYDRIKLPAGSVPAEELKRGCLCPVSFSDFQLDPFSGFFGGEIRLAYLHPAEGGEAQIFTGGSVNGSIIDSASDMVFSKEMYADSRYEGPAYVRLRGVRIAGK